MSMIPRYTDAWHAWVDAYGPEGDPPPTIPQDTLLVGGARRGERIRGEPGHAVMQVPVPTRAYYSPDKLPPTGATFKVDTYESRKWAIAWDANPIRVWVLQGLSDTAAQALLEEWRG